MASRPDATARIGVIDAARGLAMIGVFMSHFAWGLDEQGAWPRLTLFVKHVTMFASPSFMILSGLVTGFLLGRRPADQTSSWRDRTRLRIIDRGVFLLVVGHLVLLGSQYRRYREGVGLVDGLHICGYIPDAIAVALIAGALWLPRLATRQRVAIALGLYTLSWIVSFTWATSSVAASTIKDVLFGTLGDVEFRRRFSIAPWLAVFILGSIVGTRIAQPGTDLRRLARRLLLVGALAIVASLALKGLYFLARPEAGASWKSAEDIPSGWMVAFRLLSPFNKFPPGPAYLLLFGGIGLVLIGVCLSGSLAGRFGWLLRWSAVLGRASFAVFVVQFYVYFLVLPALPLKSGALLAVYAVASVALLWLFAWAWLRWAGNHLLTVGLPRWLSLRPSS